MRISKKNIIFSIIFPALLFVSLCNVYINKSKVIPVSLWDEMLWVGRSYFFETYLSLDFRNDVWNSFESYDQPKLAEYMYGLVLYPTYIREKETIKNFPNPSFRNFLQSRSLYGTLSNVPSSAIIFQDRDSGDEDYYYHKYGERVFKTLELIYRARIINFILLSASVIIFYFIMMQHVKSGIALVFAFIYGYNSQLIYSGIKAHSEALFIFLFNASIFLLLRYFAGGKPLKSLFLFSMTVGLCMSTKLNGLLLLFSYYILEIWQNIRRIRYPALIQNMNRIMLSTTIALFIFIILNPFTFSNPFMRGLEIFEFRRKTSISQSKIFPEASLPDPFSRIRKTYNVFFSPTDINYIGTINFFGDSGRYAFIRIAIFFGGVAVELRKIYQKSKISLVIMTFFFVSLGALSQYLVFNATRYHIHLLVFALLFQASFVNHLWSYFFKNREIILGTDIKKLLQRCHTNEK
jgi:hypothetical protein